MKEFQEMNTTTESTKKKKKPEELEQIMTASI